MHQKTSMIDHPPCTTTAARPWSSTSSFDFHSIYFLMMYLSGKDDFEVSPISKARFDQIG